MTAVFRTVEFASTAAKMRGVVGGAPYHRVRFHNVEGRGGDGGSDDDNEGCEEGSVMAMRGSSYSSDGGESVTNTITDMWSYYIRSMYKTTLRDQLWNPEFPRNHKASFYSTDLKIYRKQDAKANGPSPADGKASIRLAHREMDHQYFTQYTASTISLPLSQSQQRKLAAVSLEIAVGTSVPGQPASLLCPDCPYS
uniref:Uncharacterized protein n=1 Tax=Oryza punctata TaxID=4537 RepID=A0A0E0LIR3_ORYPU